MSVWLARFRVPLGWALGVGALLVARPTTSGLLAGLWVAAAGEALRVWASGHLEKDRRLATEGPYSWTRNPLYLGSLVLGAGFCIAAGRPVLILPLAVLFLAVYLPVMRREASRLQAAFPSEYPGYASRVPLFLPRIRPPSRQTLSPGACFSWGRVRRNREHLTLLGLFAVAGVLAGKMAWGG